MARELKRVTPLRASSASSTAPMRAIEQPIVIGAENNEVRKPGPVTYPGGWLAAADRAQQSHAKVLCFGGLAQTPRPMAFLTPDFNAAAFETVGGTSNV